MRRRDFWKAATVPMLTGGVGPRPIPIALLKEAREAIRSGKTGPVHLCRVGHRDWLPAASFVLEAQAYVPEVDPRTDKLVFLGRDATLEVGSAGIRMFPEEATRPGAR